MYDLAGEGFLARPCREVRLLVIARCDDQMTRYINGVVLSSRVPPSVLQASGDDFLAETGSKPEMSGVRLQVSDQLRPRWVLRVVLREGEIWQFRPGLVRVQAQPFVVTMPGGADPIAPFEQHEGNPGAPETGRNAEPRRTRPDDHRLYASHVFGSFRRAGMVTISHHDYPSQNSRLVPQTTKLSYGPT